MMFRTRKNKIRFSYKELIRCVIAKNTHLVFSLRSDDKISIAQMFNIETDEELIDSHVKNALSLFRGSIINVLNSCVYIVTRLPQEEIPAEYRKFVADLKSISTDSQNTFIQSVKSLGYPPRQFQGEKYDQFNQSIQGNEFYE